MLSLHLCRISGVSDFSIVVVSLLVAGEVVFFKASSEVSEQMNSDDKELLGDGGVAWAHLCLVPLAPGTLANKDSSLDVSECFASDFFIPFLMMHFLAAATTFPSHVAVSAVLSFLRSSASISASLQD